MSGRAAWPALPLEEWWATYETLHLWAQMVGKTRLALAPMQNHWWQVALYVSSRGLGGSPLPYGGQTVDIDFDFLDHRLVVRRSDGATRALALVPRSVADFYGEYRGLWRDLGMDVRIRPVPAEIPDAIPFGDDRRHASYDPDAAQRCWRALVQADRVLRAFRGRFLGKCSPVHFWWGGFDLSCTRFSGRPAPPHPGGIPNLPDRITREAYSHECISAGWWPGGGALSEPAFYAYSYPEPARFAQSPVRPAEAYYHPELREFILPYDAVRQAPDPDETLTEFLQSTYAAAADLARWDRSALERRD
jgi:hypothetical protein